MANEWWNHQQNQNQNPQDDFYMRRGDDRTRGGGDFGRRIDSEPYRAGDQDAHRNDRDMAFGNFNQRPVSQSGMGRGDQNTYSRHDMGGMSRSDYTSDMNTWRGQNRDRDMGFGYGGGGAGDIRRDEFRSNAWERENTRTSRGTGYGAGFGSTYGSYDPYSSNASGYESSRFNRNEQRDYGLGFGRDDNSGRQNFGQREWSYRDSYAGRGPKGYRRSDERIREEASEVLERDPYIDASEIEIEVKEGILTLRGHTEDRQQKRLAEDCVAHLSGVKDVRNELMVNQTLFQRAKEALFGGSTESISDTSKGDLVSDGTTQTKRNPRH